MFSAVDWSTTVSNHVSLWGSLLKFRHKSSQYINLRPVRLFEDVPHPLANRKPGNVNYYVMRENTEGEYTSLGDTTYRGIDHEIVTQESVYSHKDAERLLKFAFGFAQSRQRKHVALATKSNDTAINVPWQDKRVDETAQGYPDVTLDKQHIDTLTVRFVLRPGRSDVVTATNLPGDILSDLDPATIDTIRLASSVNLNPDRTLPSLFEPVHGSTPDIYSKNIANPTVMIWSGALMLNLLTQGQGMEHAAHDAIIAVVETVLREGPHTPDLDGTASITQMGKVIVAHLG